MKIINDSRLKTYFVQSKNAAINTYIAGPTNGAHRATRLTLHVGKTRVDLNGNQIRALRNVLDKSKTLAGVRTRKTTKVAMETIRRDVTNIVAGVIARKAVKAAKPAKPVKPGKPATKPVKTK
jgi:hypothetical protein